MRGSATFITVMSRMIINWQVSSVTSTMPDRSRPALEVTGTRVSADMVVDKECSIEWDSNGESLRFR